MLDENKIDEMTDQLNMVINLIDANKKAKAKLLLQSIIITYGNEDKVQYENPLKK